MTPMRHLTDTAIEEQALATSTTLPRWPRSRGFGDETKTPVLGKPIRAETLVAAVAAALK
jgi:hypothetical protein